MELKTLKDFISNKNGECEDFIPDASALKQSAINDIKELREGKLKDSYSIQCAGKQPLNENVVDYIKWKFNITEEDLK